ncbi:pentatricopeptide repeat-containing protein At2g17033-like [Zingiber officinale]|uniref:Smr domain-containing protein n=1 Tax=Zingiber officinale TaxID=94328 RepID=A0A8J5L862_ZINOF|nr:pentatricopeptide repeat-containing protein At2g17033-like [Zingiber officinale]KAG6517531.1 hypothetical protein ZIOFF_020923 [Zingiber officinale]
MALIWTAAGSSLSASATLRCAALPGSGKHADRLLSALHTASPHDSAATHRLIRKFLAKSSKSAALFALSRFLYLSSPYTLAIYEQINDASWFKWKSKLAASVIAVLEKQGRYDAAQTLASDAVARLNASRDLALFYCDLIDAFSEQGLTQSLHEAYEHLQEIPFSDRRFHGSSIKALCSMGKPADAEEKLNEMASSGFEPSPPEFKMVIQSYGQLGLFSEMRKILRSMEDAGAEIDTVCCNIALSCYGHHGKLSEMVSWMEKMRALGVGFSVRTFNCVLNSCPALLSICSKGTIQSFCESNSRALPLSVDALLKKLEAESPSSSSTEALLVKNLIASSVLDENLEWSSSGSKLDLHGFHVTSAYIILLNWMQELRLRFSKENAVPLEISIICGTGNHSQRRGQSPIKILVREIMFQTSSPMKIDRKNPGRFVASGKAIKEWLC